MSLTIFALICAAISLGLGFVWYGKPLFGKAWSALSGMAMPEAGAGTKAGMKKMMIQSFLQFIGSFLTSAVLFMMLRLFGAVSFGTAYPIALVLFVGFVLPFEIGAVIWNGKQSKAQLKMWAISTGYQVALFVLWLVVYALAS